MQVNKITVFPDYFNRFSTQSTEHVEVLTNTYFISNVSMNNGSTLGLQLAVRLDPNKLYKDVIYPTFIEKIS